MAPAFAAIPTSSPTNLTPISFTIPIRYSPLIQAVNTAINNKYASFVLSICLTVKLIPLLP